MYTVYVYIYIWFAGMPVRNCLLYLMLTRLQGSRRRLSAQVAAKYSCLDMLWAESLQRVFIVSLVQCDMLSNSEFQGFTDCDNCVTDCVFSLSMQVTMYRTRSALADHGMLTVEPFFLLSHNSVDAVNKILSYMSRFVMSTFQ